MKRLYLMDTIYKKIALVQSSEPAKHLRNAKKEVLLAMRALIDTAINEIEEKNRKTGDIHDECHMSNVECRINS